MNAGSGERLPGRAAWRVLPAVLGVVLPLAALAVLGATELGRQQERAETAIRHASYGFLRTTAAELAAAIRDLELPLFDDARHRPDASAEALARSWRADHPEVLAVFELDADGKPVARRRPLSLATPGVPGLVQADQAALRGDRGAAIERLREALREPSVTWRRRARITVRLAGLLRDRGTESTELLRALLAELPDPMPPRAQAWAVLGNLLLAELEAERSGSDAPLVEFEAQLMELPGRWSSAPAGLVWTVFDRIDGRLSTALDDPLRQRHEAFRPTVELLIESDRVHTLASNLQARWQEAWSAAESTADAERLIELTADGFGHAIQFVARPHTDGRWLAIAFDLTAIVAVAFADRLAQPAPEFLLDAVTPSGVRILGARLPPGAEDPGADAVVASLPIAGGALLRAVPPDTRELLTAQAASERNKLLLTLGLCLVAATASFLLVRAVHREAELARLEVDLVSRVSHELRTPLALIKMYGETLEQGRTKSPEQASRFAGIISRESDRLSGLIDRVLDFSARASGHRTIDPEPLDLGEAVTRVCARYEPTVSGAGSALHCTATTQSLPANVDRSELECAITNLIDNAVKYTPPDRRHEGVRVTIGVGDHPDRAWIDVTDSGVGIPPAERKRVFSSFYRASTAGEVRGAGLGLNQVASFAQAHDGTARALDRLDGTPGTTIRICLPLSQPRNLAQRDVPGTPPPAPKHTSDEQ